MLRFQNDYSEGAHPNVLRALCDTNLCSTPGYGLDDDCRRAADAIRARFNVKKVTSSHAKGECVILSEEALDETALRAAIAGTGYELKSLNSEEYKKKGFLGLVGG